MEHYGQVDASSTLRVFFTTHAGTGAAVAPSSALEAADVRIYKDGSATQRNTEAGYTMTSPFDSLTGLHLLSVDLSDNTDAGFYAAGSRYTVVLSPDETVDSVAVVRVLADFTIGPVAANTTQFAGTAITSAAGIPEVKVASLANDAITAASIAANAIGASEIADGAIDAGAIAADAITAAKLAADVSTEINAAVLAVLGTPAGASVSADIAAIEAQTDDIGAAGAGLTALATQASVNAIDDFLDTEIAAILAAVDTEVAAIKAVTDLFTAAQSEPTGVPAANATPMAKIAWLAMIARNKITQTATTQLVLADDGTTTVGTSTVSDDGTTATRGEFA